MTESISFKIYPGCAYVDAIADAIFKILDKVKKAGKTLDYHEVEAIKISNSLLSTMMDDMSRPFTSLEEITRVQSPVALNFYQPYNVAVILIDQKLTPEQFTIERITDPEVHALAQKVEIAPDIGFSAKSAQIVPFKDIPKPGFHLGQWDFGQWKMYCGCKVAIKMRNGENWSAKVEIPIGAAGGEPYSMEKKFIQEGTFVGLSDSQLKGAIEMVNDLENHNVRDLISYLIVK